MQDEPEVLASISASFPRRWLGIGCLYALAALLIYIAVTEPPAPGWQLFLIGFGLVSFLLGDRMRRLTARVIELTREELRDTSGAVIARIADIERVDRSMFAFKPSNGFMVRTRTAQGPRAWVPGLWWRIGRQIGVGGVTAAPQTRYMTDLLTAMLAERDGKLP